MEETFEVHLKESQVDLVNRTSELSDDFPNDFKSFFDNALLVASCKEPISKQLKQSVSWRY